MAKSKNAGKSTTKGEDSGVIVQLATRIPKALHRELKQACVAEDVSIMDAVIAGIAMVCANLKRGKGLKAA